MIPNKYATCLVRIVEGTFLCLLLMERSFNGLLKDVYHNWYDVDIDVCSIFNNLCALVEYDDM